MPSLPLSDTASTRGLSLVEMVVAVALIGVLLAIAFPLFGNVRSSAQQAACQGKLRQLGGALRLYLNEHRDVFPPVGTAHSLLAPYLGVEVPLTDPLQASDTAVEPFLCPADREPTRAAIRSYAINFYLGEVDKPTVQNITRMAQVLRPSRTLYIIDGYRRSKNVTHQARVSLGTYGFGGGEGAEFGARFNHRQMANLLFVDGHVESLSREATQARAQELLFPKFNP